MKLSVCESCGCEPVVAKADPGWIVKCEGCDAETGYYSKAHWAVNAWNRSQGEQKQYDEAEVLVALRGGEGAKLYEVC